MNKKAKYSIGHILVLMAYLQFMQFAQNFIELNSVESTNNYALQLLKENKAQHGTCIFAHNQTAGKGQMGKQWIADANKNITVSIVIDANTGCFKSDFSLMAFAGVGCNLFLREVISEEVKIKWPNDVFINDKKAGGILIETCLKNQNKFAVIGIGLNINQDSFPEKLSRAISLKQITNKDYELLNLTEQLWSFIFSFYEKWKQFSSIEILDLYNNLLFKKNEIVKLRKGNIITKGTLKGVNQNGELELENALWESYTVGSVEWIFD